jgi:hypothetical protein
MVKEQPTGGLVTDEIATNSATMHERGHTFYGTTHPHRCDDAGKWAARRLITPRNFLTACRAANGLEDLADALAVEPADVCNYMADLDPDEWLIMVRLTGHDGICDGSA